MLTENKENNMSIKVGINGFGRIGRLALDCYLKIRVLM